MYKGFSIEQCGDSSVSISSSFPSPSIPRGYVYEHNGENYTVTYSKDVVDTMVSIRLVLNVCKENHVIKRLINLVIGELRRYFYLLDSWENLRCCKFYFCVLSPSSTILSSLKFELLNYTVSGRNHVLKLKCITFQERDALACAATVNHFFQGYIKRPTSVYPICKWRFCGSPSLLVTWVISFPQFPSDANNTLRSDLLKESWNDYYSNCNWCEKRVSGSRYLDYVLRVTGGFSFSNKIKQLRKKRIEEVDDVIFDKYADKDTKYSSLPVLPVVLISFSLLLLFAIFCFIIFIFPMIKKYLFY